MVQAGGGADAIFTQGYRYIFGMYPRASRSAFPAVDALAGLNPKPKTFTVVFSNDPFSKPQGEGVIKRLERDAVRGDRDIRTSGASAGRVCYAHLGARQNSRRADVPHDRSNLIVDRASACAGQVDLKMLFTSLGPQTASFRDALGKYADGITCISTWSPTFPYKDPIFGSTARFDLPGEQSGAPFVFPPRNRQVPALVAYCWALQQVERVDDGNAVRDALARIDIKSLYGRIKFTPEGDGDPVLMGSAVQQVAGWADQSGVSGRSSRGTDAMADPTVLER